MCTSLLPELDEPIQYTVGRMRIFLGGEVGRVFGIESGGLDTGTDFTAKTFDVEGQNL
jgi:hypothetical protein